MSNLKFCELFPLIEDLGEKKAAKILPRAYPKESETICYRILRATSMKHAK